MKNQLKTKKTIPRIPNFGCATAITGEDLRVRVQLNSTEIQRLLKEVALHFSKKQSVVDAAKIISRALDDQSFLCELDVFVANEGVNLEVITRDAEFSAPKATPAISKTTKRPLCAPTKKVK